jgi:hypothetical protein
LKNYSTSCGNQISNNEIPALTLIQEQKHQTTDTLAFVTLSPQPHNFNFPPRNLRALYIHLAAQKGHLLN